MTLFQLSLASQCSIHVSVPYLMYRKCTSLARMCRKLENIHSSTKLLLLPDSLFASFNDAQDSVSSQARKFKTHFIASCSRKFRNTIINCQRNSTFRDVCEPDLTSAEFPQDKLSQHKNIPKANTCGYEKPTKFHIMPNAVYAT